MYSFPLKTGVWTVCRSDCPFCLSASLSFFQSLGQISRVSQRWQQSDENNTAQAAAVFGVTITIYFTNSDYAICLLNNHWALLWRRGVFHRGVLLQPVVSRNVVLPLFSKRCSFVPIPGPQPQSINTQAQFRLCQQDVTFRWYRHPDSTTDQCRAKTKSRTCSMTPCPGLCHRLFRIYHCP